MMDNARRCVICGKLLPPKRSKYCSAVCAAEGERARERERGGRKERPAPFRWITCPDCGREVYVHIKSVRCPDCQRIADNRANNEHRQRAKAGHSRKLGSTDLCAWCGKPYVVRGGKQRYCPACAPVASAANMRAVSREWNREHYGTEEAKEARNAGRRAVKPYSKVCAVCGATFATDDARTLCCSEACERQRLRDYWRRYEEQRREGKRKAEKDRYKAAMADPDKRAERNRKAREAYARRKAKKEDQHD